MYRCKSFNQINLSLKKYQKYFQKHKKKSKIYIFKVGWTKLFKFE